MANPNHVKILNEGVYALEEVENSESEQETGHWPDSRSWCSLPKITVSICYGERRPNEPAEREKRGRVEPSRQNLLCHGALGSSTETPLWIPVYRCQQVAGDAKYI
jgi:hypothetical protein